MKKTTDRLTINRILVNLTKWSKISVLTIWSKRINCPMAPVGRPPTQRKALFIEAYARSGDAVYSAEKAGYAHAGTTGHKMATRYSNEIAERRDRIKLKCLHVSEKALDKLDKRLDDDAMSTTRDLNGVAGTALKYGMAPGADDESSTEAFEMSPGESARVVARATRFLEAQAQPSEDSVFD